MNNNEQKKEEIFTSLKVLPKYEICPNGYDDCSGCGSCELYKYYIKPDGTNNTDGGVLEK